MPTTLAKQILSCNHSNKKVVGGKHNVLIHYVNATLSNEILCGSFLIKNHVVICVPTTLAKQILSCNHMNKKVVGGKHNVLVYYVNVCAPEPSGVVS